MLLTNCNKLTVNANIPHGYITSLPPDAMARVIFTIGQHQCDTAEFINDGRELRSEITGRVYGVSGMKVCVESEWKELSSDEIKTWLFSDPKHTFRISVYIVSDKSLLHVEDKEIQFELSKPTNCSSWTWDALYPAKTTIDDVQRAAKDPLPKQGVVRPHPDEDPYSKQGVVRQYETSQISSILTNFFQRAKHSLFDRRQSHARWYFTVLHLPKAIQWCVIFGAYRWNDKERDDLYWRPAEACVIYKDGLTAEIIVLRNKDDLTRLLNVLVDAPFDRDPFGSEMPSPSWPSIEQRLDRLLLA
jgi:hypothetical protein